MFKPHTADTDAGTGVASSDHADVRVLLAEDDRDYRETVRLWLSENGWRVTEAADGEEALQKLDESIDILVLDRRMPELAGPDVVDKLRDTDFQGRVIVLSAFEPDEHLNEEHVAEYLLKPTAKQELIETLEKYR